MSNQPQEVVQDLQQGPHVPVLCGLKGYQVSTPEMRPGRLCSLSRPTNQGRRSKEAEWFGKHGEIFPNRHQNRSTPSRRKHIWNAQSDIAVLLFRWYGSFGGRRPGLWVALAASGRGWLAIWISVPFSERLEQKQNSGQDFPDRLRLPGPPDQKKVYGFTIQQKCFVAKIVAQI